jgi:hypothetical protein
MTMAVEVRHSEFTAAIAAVEGTARRPAIDPAVAQMPSIQ